MSTPFSVTVVELHETSVVVSDAEGARWSLPLAAIAGKPVLHQPLFISAASPQAESSSAHPLSQAIVEHLLEPSP